MRVGNMQQYLEIALLVARYAVQALLFCEAPVAIHDECYVVRDRSSLQNANDA